MSGLSTKQTVSEISGRGVGLDAVRSLLQDLGGELWIELLDPGGLGPFYRFRFTATLPFEIFLESRFPSDLAS